MSDSADDQENEIKVSVELGTPEWNAVESLVNTYQSSANSIRAGREKVGHKLGDHWNDWYNNLMVICFTLGGALIAVATAIKFNHSVNTALFWAGDILLLLDGLYILLLRKSRLERESTKAVTMGYEIEYYSLVAKNKVLDVLKGKPFKQKEFEDAKNKLVSTALSELDTSYEETGKVEDHMDVMTVVFIASLGLLVLSSIQDIQILKPASLVFLMVILGILLVFRKNAAKPKDAIQERNKWLKKIQGERIE